MTHKTKKTQKTVATLTHKEASRKNIPTAEYQSVMREEEKYPIRVAYEPCNRDLDPQLVWCAKEKKAAMQIYWVPGVNNLGRFGRWAFAEVTEVYQIEADFEAKVEAEFNKMIAQTIGKEG